MNCKNCNNILQTKNIIEIIKIKGKDIKVETPRMFCTNCNEVIYNEEYDNNTLKEVFRIYLQEEGIQKEQIINLRKKYDLSQELFSKIIGCAKKTLISYEQGNSIPNDIYLIMLKTLIENPETIKYFIESNKQRFTDKEYTKIKKLNLGSNDDLVPENGYTKFNLEKLKDIIVILSKNSINKTKLLKELFLIDFQNYKEYGYSITGLKYVKLPHGPVPNNFEKILIELVKSKTIEYEIVNKGDYESHIITSKIKDNKNLLESEKQIVKNIKNKFLKYSVNEIINYTHKQTFFNKTKEFESINYDYAFEIE